MLLIFSRTIVQKFAYSDYCLEVSVIDDCNPNPCQNGGTCTDGINTFTCDCEEDFTGKRCELSK